MITKLIKDIFHRDHFIIVAMRRFILTLLLVTVFVPSVSGQRNEPRVAGRGQGSAARLEGNIYVLTIFLSENARGNNTSYWTSAETDVWFRKLRKAENWLQKEAARYGKRISFTGGYFGLDPLVAVDEIESGTGSGNERVDWVKVALTAVGYESPMAFLKWVQTKTDCQSALIIVVADKKGRSYAIPFSDINNREDFFVEGIMAYTQYESGTGLYPASIAHEICHVFGAEDLYANFSQTEKNEAIARQRFPDDIMIRIEANLENLQIGPFTAWLLGLTDQEEPWYRSLLPPPRDRTR